MLTMWLRGNLFYLENFAMSARTYDSLYTTQITQTYNLLLIVLYNTKTVVSRILKQQIILSLPRR